MRVQNSFVKSLPITAKALSEKFGITVEFKDGATPSTNGKGIILPTLVEDSQVEDRNALLGSLVHECSHIRNTDFSDKFTRDLPHGVFSGLNAIEDLRIEDLACKQYPGAGFMLTASSKNALAGYDWEKLVKENKVMVMFLFAMLYSNQHLSPYFKGKFLIEYEGAERAALAAIGKKNVAKVKALMDQELSGLKSTQDSLDLAEKLFKLLDNKARNTNQSKKKQNQQQQDQQDQSSDSPSENGDQNQEGQGQGGQQNQQDQDQNGSNGQSGKDGESKSDESQNSDGNTDQQESGNGSSKNTSGDQGYTMPEGISKASKDNRKKGFDNPLDVSKKLKKDMEKAGRETQIIKNEESKSRCAPEPTEEQLCGSSNGTRFSEKEKRDGSVLENEAGRLAAGLVRGMIGLVQTMSAKPACTGYTGKRLDYANISRISTWDLRVFKKTTIAKSQKTIVHILLDRSGSMQGVPMETAKAVSVALYQAVSRLPEAKGHISIFPGSNSTDRETIVPLGANIKRLMPHVARTSAWGGTPFMQAVEQERQLMKSEIADKKVLIVLTDGDTNGPKVDELKERLVKDGIVFGAIGIDVGDEYGLNKFFGENYIFVNEIRDLPTEFMGLARRMIINR